MIQNCKLFGEVIIVLCISYKKHVYSPIKVDKKDFNMAHMTEKLKAPSVEYKNAFLKKKIQMNIL